MKTVALAFLVASSAHAACPTEADIRNMEVSASSVTLRGLDKDFALEDVRRARQCLPPLTLAEKEELRAGRRAARAPAPAAVVTNCDAAGCWDTSGTRYNRSAGGFFRQDGRACQQVGNELHCN